MRGARPSSPSGTSALKEKMEAEELMRKAEKDQSKPDESSVTDIKGWEGHNQKC